MRMLALLLSLILLSPYANAYDARPIAKGDVAPYEGIVVDIETSKVVYRMALENPIYVRKIESLEKSLSVQTDSLKTAENSVQVLGTENQRLKKSELSSERNKWLYGIGGLVLGAFLFRQYGR